MKSFRGRELPQRIPFSLAYLDASDRRKEQCDGCYPWPRTRSEQRRTFLVLGDLGALGGKWNFRVYSPRRMPTFYDRFLECEERWPNNVALELQRHDQIESCTYADLRRMAESIGRWIDENGFARGSRLAIVADNHPRWVAAYLGIIASGCTVVPLDTALHADQLTKLLKDSGSSVLFCDAKHAQPRGKRLRDLNVGLVLMDPDRMANHPTGQHWLGNLPAIFEGGPGNFQPAPSKTDDIASLLYTSGTTADPKGVMLTHANFLGEVEAVFNWVEIGPSDALLGVLPMFHVLAQMANLLLPLVKGSRVVYLETLNTTELLRALRDRNITAFAVVPQFFYLIHQRIFEEIEKRGVLTQRMFKILVALNRNLRRFGINAGPILFGKVHETLGKKMRYLVTGGSRFDPAIAKDFYDLGIDVLQAYGLTETTAAVFANSPGNNVIGSVGKAMKGVEAKIVDPHAAGRGRTRDRRSSVARRGRDEGILEPSGCHRRGIARWMVLHRRSRLLRR